MSLLELLPNCSVVSTVSQEEDEKVWLAVRSKGIGGSDIGPICGVSNFSTARSIYLKKTGQYEEVIEEGSAAAERMRFGHLLEPIVASEFEVRTGLRVVDLGATVQHKDFPWALANIDRLVLDDDGKPVAVLECKTTSSSNFSDWDEGDIPVTYIYQLQWYLWVLDLPIGHFACLIGGNRFVHIEVPRNDELLKDVIIPAADRFWNYNVKNLIEPELTGSSVDSDLIKEMYPEVEKNSEVVLEGDELNELAEIIKEGKAQIKQLEKDVDAAANKLKEKLKNNEIGYTSDHIVKWSPRVQERVDTDLLKTRYPEVYMECKKKIAFRVFTVK